MQRAPFRCIGAKQAESLLRSVEVLVLDARDAASYRRGHIRGAHHVTISTLSTVIEDAEKGVPVLIYCYRGFASREYAQLIAGLGFSAVYSLDGGYEAWRKKSRAPRKARLSGMLQKWLVEHGFPHDDINATIANEMTPLMKACHKGDVAVIRELISAGARLNARNADGNNALWLACVGEHVDVIDLLVDSGIDLNNSNVNGATALMYAASAGKAGAVARLLERGAETAPETPEGFTALDMAATIECLTLLRRATRSDRKADATQSPA
jgi:rhodanese-related sulfurtransferase